MKKIIYGQDDRVGPWVCRRINATWIPGQAKTIGLEEEGELIGGCLIESYIAGGSVSMHVAGEPGWCTRSYLRAAFRYVFVQLDCNVAIGVVPSGNSKALAFDWALGFREHTRIEGAHPDGALVLLTMRKEDCKWL